MNASTTGKQQAKTLRRVRKIHRTMGALLFVFFFIIAVTGLLLGWKKHSGNLLQPMTYRGSSTDLKEWLPLDSLYRNACTYLRDSVDASLSPETERIDVRKDKGVVKFIFTRHFTEIQIDGATGKVLHTAQRRSDIIEKIHDGSIADFFSGNGSGIFKLVYTSITGLALLLFTITGFWLWYGPRKLRRRKQRSQQE